MKKNIVSFCVVLSASMSVNAQTDLKLGATEAEDANSPKQVIFIDKETGQMVSKPSEQDLQSADQKQFKSIDISGVASEPKLMPDGSRKIDFNGQFMTPLTAEIDLQGGVSTKHESNIKVKNKD